MKNASQPQRETPSRATVPDISSSGHFVLCRKRQKALCVLSDPPGLLSVHYYTKLDGALTSHKTTLGSRLVYRGSESS